MSNCKHKFGVLENQVRDLETDNQGHDYERLIERKPFAIYCFKCGEIKKLV